MEIKKMGLLGVALTALALGACEKKSSSSNNSSGAAAVPPQEEQAPPPPTAPLGKCWENGTCTTYAETTEDECKAQGGLWEPA